MGGEHVVVSRRLCELLASVSVNQNYKDKNRNWYPECYQSQDEEHEKFKYSDTKHGGASQIGRSVVRYGGRGA